MSESVFTGIHLYCNLQQQKKKQLKNTCKTICGEWTWDTSSNYNFHNWIADGKNTFKKVQTHDATNDCVQGSVMWKKLNSVFKQQNKNVIKKTKTNKQKKALSCRENDPLSQKKKKTKKTYSICLII